MNIENINVTEVPDEEKGPFVPKDGKTEVRLVDVVVTDDNVALNLMVSYLNLAQKRGVFNLDEASKIWECIQRFIQKP